jgi:hypothetical protein
MRFTWSTSCLAEGDGGRGAGAGCLKVLMGIDVFRAVVDPNFGIV